MNHYDETDCEYFSKIWIIRCYSLRNFGKANWKHSKCFIIFLHTHDHVPKLAKYNRYPGMESYSDHEFSSHHWLHLNVLQYKKNSHEFRITAMPGKQCICFCHYPKLIAYIQNLWSMPKKQMGVQCHLSRKGSVTSVLAFTNFTAV